MDNTITTLISNMCSHDCVFSCFKDKCPRGSWCKPAFETGTLPQVGEDTECPLMQFEAKNLPERTIRLDYWDTWDICEACKYSEIIEQINVDEPMISISKAFYTHCMDCPVKEIRDALSEAAAEAGCS